MSQSEEANSLEFNLAIFYWLVEDWQGCKKELNRLIKTSSPNDHRLAQILEIFIYLEQKKEKPESLKGFTNQSLEYRDLFKRFLLISIEKELLKAKYSLGEEISDSRIRKLLESFTQGAPTTKSTELVKLTIIQQENPIRHQSTTNSVNTWLTALQRKSIPLTIEELLEAETTVNLLNVRAKDTLSYKRILADEMMAKNGFQDASRLYQNIIESSEASEQLVVRLARAKRNLGQLEDAIEILEANIEKLGRKPLLLHTLAIYRRDYQDLPTSLQLVKEVIRDHFEYSLKINFATFAADILRKNAEYKAAYDHLKEASNLHRNEGKETTLTVDAMLEELKTNVAGVNGTFFEVSSVFYDTIYKNSDKYALQASDSVYEPTWKEVCKIIEKENFEKVIDIGCGPGQFAEYLTGKLSNVEYVGLDFSEIAIKLAKERCPHLHFSCEDVRNYTSEKTNKETVYVMLEVLEHIKDDIGLLQLLPPGANVIFSVPNFDSFGHVRFFKNYNEIKEHFIKTLEISTFKNILIGGISSIYVMSGKVTNYKNGVL